VARNGLLGVVAAGLVFGSPPVAILLAAGAGALGLTLLERHRGEAPSAQSLPVGAEAPEFRLPGLDGHVVTLAALRGRGKPVLLVFSDAHCGPCAELAPEVARWQRELTDVLTIAVVERGREPAGGLDEHGRMLVLLQADDEVSSAYGAIGTPGAVLVDVEGRVASGVAWGADAIRRLAGQPASVESATSPDWLRPVGRREFLFRFAGASALAGVALAWPAQALGVLKPSRAGAACGPNFTCPPGMACVGPGRGVCVAGNATGCTHVDEAGVTQPGCATSIEACCAQSEGGPRCEIIVYTSNDVSNCGACGKPCKFCCRGTCPDLKRDHRNCGECFNQCPAHKPICHAGKCRDECPRGLRKCGRQCGNPRTQVCCKGKIIDKDDLQVDDLHCSDDPVKKPCGVRCGPGKTCRQGKCVPTPCPQGQTRCGGRCVDPNTNTEHCGICNRNCAAIEQTCCGGTCVDTRIRPDHCGGCFKVCPEPPCVCTNTRCLGPPGECSDGLGRPLERLRAWTVRRARARAAG
jgi:peroxiredoxin